MVFVVVYGIDEQWVVDLVEVQMLVRYNKGLCYFLMVVDVFFKYVWVRLLIKKIGEEVKKVFFDIFKEGRQFFNLQMDDGKEFYNKIVQVLFRDRGINYFFM